MAVLYRHAGGAAHGSRYSGTGYHAGYSTLSTNCTPPVRRYSTEYAPTRAVQTTVRRTDIHLLSRRSVILKEDRVRYSSVVRPDSTGHSRLGLRGRAPRRVIRHYDTFASFVRRSARVSSSTHDRSCPCSDAPWASPLQRCCCTPCPSPWTSQCIQSASGNGTAHDEAHLPQPHPPVASPI